MLIDKRQNTPRWIIFFIDLVICTFSVILSYLLRFNFSIPENDLQNMPKAMIAILSVRILSFLIAKTYTGIVRYTSTKDSVRIFLVITAGSALFFVFNLISYNFINNAFIVPNSIVIIDYLFTVFVMNAFRIMVKVAYLEMQNTAREKKYVIIFGAGESGIITKRALDRDAGTKYKVLAFIDDDPKKAGKTLEGISIYTPDKLEKLLEKNTIAQLIISIQNISPARKKGIKYQMQAEPRATGTDANAMQLARGGSAAAQVSIPNRHMHTSVEVVSLSDLEATVALIAEAISAMSGKENFIPS